MTSNVIENVKILLINIDEDLKFLMAVKMKMFLVLDPYRFVCSPEDGGSMFL
jgi:hypothetical protein